MRILYGVHTQGQGGLAKAAALIPCFLERGHTVRVITSGSQGPPTGYSFPWQQHFRGLEYVVAHGKADSFRTFQNWVRNAWPVMASLRSVQRVVDEFQPDLILSDFEPLTCSPVLRRRCEVLAASRPAALLDRQLQYPEGFAVERKFARTVIRLFTLGADRTLGYHVAPETYRCLPPVIDPQVRALRPVMGDHLLVYNVYSTAVAPADELVAWAEKNGRPVIAYGYPEIPRGRQGRVLFRPASRVQFLADLASCRGVLTTAGLSLPLEAALLGKPVGVVPILGQWEQAANAFHLEQAGLARWLTHWDYSAVLAEMSRLRDAAVRSWLWETPARIAARLVGEPLPVEVGRPGVRIAA